MRRAGFLGYLAHQISRHVERCLFVLVALLPLGFLTGQSAWLGLVFCALACGLCLVVHFVRAQSRWQHENRFIRAPWLLIAALLAGLAVLFILHWVPAGVLAITVAGLLGNLLFLEFRNRRFMAWARVRRRQRQHRRWQHQREGLQQQLAEGMHWLAALQHDIRQPLQALGLLLSSPRIQRDDRFDTLVRQLQGCHQWIYELSENATEVAAIQAHQMPPASLQPLDVCAVVSSFSNWMRPLASSKGLDIQISLPAGLSVKMLTTDERKLKRVLANLLHNALRYTETGQVCLSFQIAPRGDAVVFEISDMADPLPPHIQVQLETLCLPDAAKGGLRRGLGLFVVVSFCRQMGWGLAVESVRPKGKRISLRVPLGVDPVCD